MECQYCKRDMSQDTEYFKLVLMNERYEQRIDSMICSDIDLIYMCGYCYNIMKNSIEATACDLYS